MVMQFYVILDITRYYGNLKNRDNRAEGCFLHGGPE